MALQVETGTPYMLYKDACNGKSNQQNLGCIKSSNLCTGERASDRAIERASELAVWRACPCKMPTTAAVWAYVMRDGASVDRRV